jgi:hypothetical protein
VRAGDERFLYECRYSDCVQLETAGDGVESTLRGVWMLLNMYGRPAKGRG